MSDALEAVLSIGGAVLAVLTTVGAFYKYGMSVVDKKLADYLDGTDKRIESHLKIVDEKIKPVKELAEEALEKGIAIETNYRAQFKETNANVQSTREQVLERFGKTEGVLLNVESMLKLMMSHFTFNSSHGDKQ